MAVDGEIVIDDYVPFAFDAERGAGGNAWILLRDDARGRLFELWVDRDSGRLTHAALVGYNAVPGRMPAGWFEVPTERGAPLVVVDPPLSDGAAIPQRDYAADISFHIEAGRALIVFGGAPTRMLVGGRARFFFAGDALVGIGAEGLSPAEEAMAARR